MLGVRRAVLLGMLIDSPDGRRSLSVRQPSSHPAKEHHTMNTHERAAEDLLLAAVKEDGQPRDMDANYRETLDEIYSFKSVGGPFQFMQPSRVLELEDPTAFRCGFNDWLDSEEVTEIENEYFDSKELEDIREQVADALDSEITNLEEEAEDLKAGLPDPEPDGSDPHGFIADLKAVLDKITEKQAILAAVKAYAF